MSINKTKEQNFESYVEQTLIEKSGWKKGDLTEWIKKTALFPARIIDFIQSSQPRLYAQMKKLHGEELNEKIITTLTKELNLRGTLHILRHGF
jgi:type I restriction enzyme R subunit